jgi:hypothetical protein
LWDIENTNPKDRLMARGNFQGIYPQGTGMFLGWNVHKHEKTI